MIINDQLELVIKSVIVPGNRHFYAERNLVIVSSKLVLQIQHMAASIKIINTKELSCFSVQTTILV